MRLVLLAALMTLPVVAQHRGGSAPSPGGRVHPGTPTVPATGSRQGYRPAYPRTVVVPYPVYYGAGYVPLAADYGYAPAPPALVNPNFQEDGGTPQIVDYSNAALPEASPLPDDDTQLKDDQPTIFLIALTDHTVVAAIAYWAEGDTLNWVSRDAKQNRMSLSLVDRAFSKQLNDQRHVEFKLPPVQ